MKKLIYGSLFLALVGIGFVGCQKENLNLTSNDLSGSSPFNQDKQLTLDEFIKSVETDNERSFFEEHDIVDNRKFVNKELKSQLQQKAAGKPKIKFRWGRGGCSRPIGVCVIIPIGLHEANAQATTINGKYVVIPDTDDNGLTSDGYLPISDDLYVDENTTIKAGIYTVNYDEQQGKYTAVALDLN